MTTNLIPETKLSQKAEADCTRLLKEFFKEEPLIEVQHSGTEWDEEDFRHTYEYEAEIWLASANFDVVVDEANRPVGYVDHSKWKNCSWKDFPRNQVVPLAAETGYVPATSLLIGYGRGPNGCLEARLLTDPARADSPRYAVRINPTLGRIISILPEGLDL